MRILKRVVLIVIALIMLLLTIGFFLPSGFSTSRAITIDAPAEVIFEQIDNLRKNEAWSPWKEADPTLETTYNDVVRGVGASYSWTGEKSGAGSYTIVESSPPRHLTFEMVFDGQGDGGGDWTLEPSGDGVTVTWTFRGDAGKNPVGRYLGLLIDFLLGPQYERGLENLKKIAEAAPVPDPVEREAESDAGGV